MLLPAVLGPFCEAEVAAVRQRRVARRGLAGDGNHKAQDVVMRRRGQEANERCGKEDGWNGMEWNGTRVSARERWFCGEEEGTR